MAYDRPDHEESGQLTDYRPWHRRASLGVRDFVVSDPWRRVVLLAMFPLVVGSVLALVFRNEGGLWLEIGTSLIGGSIIGLVFAFVQHTLDSNAAERQADEEIRFTVASSADLEGVDLRDQDLHELYLRGKVLTSAKLDRSALEGVDLQNANLHGASLNGATLNGADLRGVDLTNAGLYQAGLVAAVLSGATLSGARLVHADLTKVNMVGLREAEGVTMSRAHLVDADLEAVDLRGVVAPFIKGRGINARGIDLRDADLSCADLQHACLADADCRRADFAGADFRHAVLVGADLRGARLVGARFFGADLQGANVNDAVLERADMRGAHVAHLDVAKARGGPWAIREAEGQSGDDPTAEPRMERDAWSDTWDDGRVAVEVIGDDETTAAVIALLRRRRTRLEALRTDGAAIVVSESVPDWGTAAEHGLPTTVDSNQRGADTHVRVDRIGTTAVVVAERVGESSIVRLDIDPVSDSVAALTSAVQLSLCRQDSFSSHEAIAAVAELVDSPSQAPEEIGDVVNRVARLEPRSSLVLGLQAWCAEASDLSEMEEAIDNLHVGWAQTGDRERRAVLATRLSTAQCQLLHRSRTSEADQVRILERARSSSDVALQLLLGDLDSRSRPDDRRVALLSLANHAAAFAKHVTEAPADLARGVALYEDMITNLEEHGLPVPPTTRNNLGYCLMALAGRITRGPGRDLYSRSALEFERVLDHYDLVAAEENPDANVRLRPVFDLAAIGPGGRVPPPGELRVRPVRLALANRGNLFRLHKDYDAALACYTAALHLDPAYIEAWAERAWVYADQPVTEGSENPLDLADRDARMITEIRTGTDAQKAKALVSIARAYARSLQYERMIWLVQTARELDPGIPELAELERMAATDHPGDRNDAA